MTENIFLSYRRDDSRGYTNAIYTLLELHFDSSQIFMDVDTLVPGSDFVQCLEDAVESCDIFLAIIGLRWENIKDKEGNRRLENPEDFVRIEVAHALKRGIPVIPVLVDGAEMPSSENLPDNLKELARRHAFSVGDYMRTDVERLIKVLEKTFERLERERIKLERAEEERKAREQAAVEKKAAEEKERLALQKAKAERLEKERVEAERLEKERAEAERLEKERAEAEHLENERAEAEKERIAKQKELADRKAKKKADKKAKELAVEEKKAQEKRERIAAEAERLSAKNDTAAFILSAQKAAEQGDIDQAVSWYRKAIALAPPELSGVIEKRLKDLDSLETEQTESPQTGEKDEENPARPCPVCGEQIPAGQEVCPHCQGKPKTHQELSSAPGGKNLKVTLFGSGIGLIAILGTVLIILGRGGSGPLSSLETGKQTPTGTATSTLIPTATLPPTVTPTLTETSTPSVTPTPILGVGSTRVSSKDLMTMVYIPAGIFLMGGGEVYRAPIHEVYLDAFWMDEHEVTYSQYKKFMEEARHYYDVSGEGEDHPVIYISWYGAQAYCEWAGRRLPTEAEWEKAARGKLDEKKYPWGDEEPVCDDSAENGAQWSSCDGRSVPVKSFSGNGYGLYDMAGNVYEWVSDWYDSEYYENSPTENPQGPASGYIRVLRGGAWDLQSSEMRVAERDEAYPIDSSYNIGFRCAASE